MTGGRGQTADAVARVDGPARAPADAVTPRLFGLGLAASGLLGLLLAGAALAREPLGNDEVASLALVSRPLPDFITDFASTQSAGFLFHAVLWPVVHVFGDSATALRLPSLVAFVAAIVVCGLVGARLGGRLAGLAAALLLAVCPFAVLHAQDARMYTFALCFALVALWLLLRALEEPTTGRWAAYAGALVLLGYSHELALLCVLAHVVLVLADGRRSVRRPYLVALAAAALGLIPLAAMSAANAGSDPLYYVTRPGPSVFEDVALLFAGSRAGVAVFAGTLTIAAVAAVLTRDRIPPPRVPGTWIALGVWLAVPFIALFLVSQARPLLLPRYVIGSAAAACVLLGLLLTRFSAPVAATGLAVAVLALGYGAVQVNRSLDRPDWDRVAAWLEAQPGEGRPVVFVGGQRNAAAFLYYAADDGVPRDGLPWTEDELARLPAWVGIIDRDDDVSSLRTALERLPAWVVEQGALPSDLEARLRGFLETCTTTTRREFRDISVERVTGCPTG